MMRAMMAEILIQKGIAFGNNKFCPNPLGGSRFCPESAIPIFEEVEKRFGKDNDPAIRPLYVRSFIEKAAVWKIRGNPETEIAIYDELVRRFGADPAPAVRAQVAHALLKKAGAIEDPSSLDVLDEIERRYGQDDDPEVQKVVVEMLLMRTRITGWPGEGEDERRALAIFDEIDRRFGKNVEVRRKIAEGFSLRQEVFNDYLIQRFGEDDDREVGGFVEHALIWRGMRLEAREDFEGAIAAYDDADFRAKLCAKKREGRGILGFDEKGRLLMKRGALDAALAVYEDMGRRSVQNNTYTALSLVRKGEILKEQGKFQEAIAIFDEVERRF